MHLGPLQALIRLTRLIWGQASSVLGVGLSKPTWEGGFYPNRPGCLEGVSIPRNILSVPPSHHLLMPGSFCSNRWFPVGRPPQPQKGGLLFSQTLALSQAGKTLTRVLWRGTGPCAPIQGVINGCCQCNMNAHIEKPCFLSPSLSGRQLLLSLKSLGVTHMSPLS